MRTLAMTTVVVLGLGLAAAPASAGERTGNGGFTPIGVVPSAICAFSGLEDNDGGTVEPGNTQTPHEEGGTILQAGLARICQFLNNGKNPKTPPA